MALQTDIITANGSKGHHKFTLTVNEDSTSTTNNTSSISWAFKISAIQAGWDWNYNDAVSYSIDINGNKYSGYIDSYDGKSEVTIRSGSGLSVTHNSNGAKTISYSFSVSSYNYNYLTGSASNSGSMTLTTIPRRASIVSAPDFYDTDSPTITYSNPAGTSITNIYASIMNLNGNVLCGYRSVNKTGTEYTFNFTDTEKRALWGEVTSGNTATVRFYIISEIGGETYYSSIAKTLTLTNYLPTLSPTVVDVGSVSTTLTGDNNKVIRYYNTLSYNANATGNKGATISSYSVVCGGARKTTATGTFGYADTATVTFTVTDSRGNTASRTVTKTLIDYKRLSCNLDVTAPTTGGEMEFTVSGNYWSGNFGAVDNTLQVQYRIKANDDSFTDWAILTPTINTKDHKYTLTKTLTGLNYLNSYTIQARATDKIETKTTDEKKVKTIPIFDWGENDFNFNVPISIQGVAVNDFVVEQGTSGIWFYRKWNSGLAELWGLSDDTGVNASEKSMSGFYYSASQVKEFPFTLKSIQYFNASGGSTGAVNIVRPFTCAINQMSYIVVSNTNSLTNVNVKVNLEVKGTWK